MSKQRLCRACQAKLGIDDDLCADCGARNPVAVPWYGKALGAVIALIIILLLVDVNDVMKLLGG